MGGQYLGISDMITQQASPHINSELILLPVDLHNLWMFFHLSLCIVLGDHLTACKTFLISEQNCCDEHGCFVDTAFDRM